MNPQASDTQYPDDGLDVVIETEGPGGPRLDPNTGAMEIPTEDGGVIIDFNPPRADDDDSDFDANLAEKLQDAALSTIANQLLEAIQNDDDSRAEWVDQTAKGLDLLGLKLEPPRGSAPSSSAPLDGMSTVRHPILLDSVLRFQANARGELLPPNGPVKVRDDGNEDEQSTELAEALESDLNHYLTTDAPEYYPDTDRMFFKVGYGGSGFKKVYACPIRRRPVSESVDPNDLIVSDAATDLRNAGRITQRIRMRPSVMKRMQVLGAYRDVKLTQPTSNVNQIDEKQAEIEGFALWNLRPEDQPYNLYECYCELDLPGYPDEDDDGKETGLPLPYRVVIEQDSRTILAIHRNWDEEDQFHEPQRVFVEFPYIKGFGFYGIGLLHIIGNSTMALTAAWRESLDAGMFASFPGFLISKSATRQNTNEMRIAPGTGYPIDVGSIDISKAILPLPYKDVTPGLMQLIDKVTAAAQRVGSTAEMNVGEGSQEAPVGTTLALIEQATKIESAVHKRLHQSQAEEFQLLRDLFIDDPEALWRSNPRSRTAAALGVDFGDPHQDHQAAVDKFRAALADTNLVPVADPNTPSHVHRLLKAVALKQLQSAQPELYNAREVDTRILNMIGWTDTEALFNPPVPPTAPQIDPVTAAMLAMKNRELDIKQQKIYSDQQVAAEQANAKRQDSVMQLAKEIAIHGANADADRVSQQAELAGQQMQNTHEMNLQANEQANAPQESSGGRVSGDGVKRGKDGGWYIEDSVRPGKYLKMRPHDEHGFHFVPVSHDPFAEPKKPREKSKRVI